MAEFAVRRLTPDDWARLRAIRIAALTDTPAAFGATLAHELSFDEDRWRGWLARDALFLAEAGEGRVGIAGGMAGPNEVELVSVWAHPDTRGTGLAATVVGAVVDWARAEGHPRITAWADQTNDRALRFYRGLGFTPTGRDDIHPHDPALREVELALAL
ncbi:GNAT family N-acetyltransferase [Actinokineospora sp.]|uniref:GNAT family N-acetyltransferase n=1 Tax=Actinokineospora sp. TaxID=1872133 RepID=UPI004037796F